MTIESQPSGEAAVTTTETPAVVTEASVTPATRTVEDVEKEYRDRIAGKDRAHDAEMKTVRGELDRLRAAEQQRQQAETEARRSQMTAEQVMQDQIKTLTDQMNQRERDHLTELRKIRFPTVAAELDDAILAATDEGKLAALEAKLTAGQTAPPPSLIDSNSAARSNGTTPVTTEKSIEDLKADLAREGAAFRADLEATGALRPQSD